MKSVVEIEVAGDNRNLFFAPLSRVLRGELDFAKIADPNGRMAGDKWPGPIPGVRLGLDTKTGDGWVYDQLYDEAHQATREQVEQYYKLGPERESFFKVDVASWLYRMKAACECGTARLVDGAFPDKLPGKPVMRYLTMDAESREDKRDAVLDRMAIAIDRLTDVLLEMRK